MTKDQELILKNQFVELSFSENWKKKLQEQNFDDNELIRYCLNKAWPDAVIHVRMKTTPADIEILEHKEEIKDTVFESIVKQEWKEDFDEWHDDFCKKQICGMRYGVWQKFINMSFKYLYCVNDRLHKPLQIDFTKCHLPIDDNTLLWCRNKEITHVTAWNNISRNDYIAIRDGVKLILQDKPDLTSALQLDFIVWRIKKICDVLSSIKNLNDDLSGLESFKSWFTSCGYNICNKQELEVLLTQIQTLETYISQ